MTTDIPEDVKLVIGLMGAMQNQNNSVSSSLITGLTVSERTYRAQLAVARNNVIYLTSQPYLPHPQAVVNAMFPGPAAVEGWLEAHYSGDWRDPATPATRCYACRECDL